MTAIGTESYKIQKEQITISITTLNNENRFRSDNSQLEMKAN